MKDVKDDEHECNINMDMLKEQIALILQSTKSDSPELREFFVYTMHMLFHVQESGLLGLSFGVKQGEKVLFLAFGNATETSQSFFEKTAEGIALFRKTTEENAAKKKQKQN